jgi:REP element-mobilizing transposase RayT
MGRPLRIEYAGALYHITSRGNEKKEIFLDDADRTKFLQILEDYHDRYGILIHGYVLMDNHYHLILETPQGNLLKVMHGINGSYTGYFNRRYKRSGHLFQGRYRGILIERDAYLVSLSRYIHLNPVRAGIVVKPEEYRWSSYPGYLNEEKGQEWVEYSWVLAQFGDEEDKARRGYRNSVEEVLKTRIENPMNKLYGKMVLGEKSFIEKIREMVKEKTISREIVERKRLRDNPLPDTIMKTVQRFCGVTREGITLKG